MLHQRFDNTLFDTHIGFQFVYKIEFKDVLRAGEPMETHRRENRLRPEKVARHIRRWDWTHGSDLPAPLYANPLRVTAELFLTIGPDCNESQICGWYKRFMRDEVLAEWKDIDEGPALHVYCHVSGGFVFGSAPLRYGIFQDELPLVLEALRYGDSSFFAAHPQLDNAPIWVHF
jgi:Staygreen protein